MSLRVERFVDVDAYLERAGPFLAAREPQHILILGITAGIRTFPEIAGDHPYMAAVLEGDRVVMAALRTPPYRVVLSEIDDPAFLAPLVEDLSGHPAGDVPGVMGPVPGVERFAELWAAWSGRTARETQAERIFKLEHVNEVRRPSGSMRDIVEADRALLSDWLRAFAAEAVPEDPVIEPDPIIDRALAGSPVRGLRLWEEAGRPVSVAGFGGPTPNGIRIGPVYTPPDLRARGYATALVADLSAERLAAGKRFCFLFTDLANPTSNHIYQEIGYEPVRDVAVWQFRDPEPAASS
jgi:predicted GNAT family acetyltransferase